MPVLPDTLPSAPVLVFYDTEFTDLAPGSELLSIGLVVAGTDDELYIEISDANLSLASDFVVAEVLPLMGRHKPLRLTKTEAAAAIDAWLDTLRAGDRSTQIVMVSDSSWDWRHLVALQSTIGENEPWAHRCNVTSQMIQSLLKTEAQGENFYEAVEAFYRSHSEQHHALVDARSLKCGLLGAQSR